MKCIRIFTLFIFLGLSGFSIEICDNGIDDDADGLIDLNDPDCDCHNSASTSLLPNHDFENYSTCPSTYSQMSRCDDWIQAGLGTSDYYNTCNTFSRAPLIFPSKGTPTGNGHVGFLNSTKRTATSSMRSLIRKEYIGVCLSSPLVKGKKYIMNFKLGFGKSTRPMSSYYSPKQLEVALYGSNSCSDMPFNSFDCPTNFSGNFIELTSKVFYGDDEWKYCQVIFTPTIDVYSFLIGPSCSDTDVPVWYNELYPPKTYYFLDELMLTESQIDSNEIMLNGDYCNNDLYIGSELSVNETIQWYKDGIAIVGETSKNLSLDSSERGNFQCVIIDSDSKCSRSNVIDINTSKECDEVSFYVPNSFTPNGDGINDLFLPVFSYPDRINQYSFSVYNRWGEQIFNTLNPKEGWIGTYKNIHSPTGIYFWKLKINKRGVTDPIEKYGYFFLIK